MKPTFSFALVINKLAWMAVLVVVMIVLMMSEFGTSQSPLRVICGRNTAMSSSSFFSNLNSTMGQLRSQLLNKGVYYARANQDSVYGLAQCSHYLSTSQCVACFEAAVSAVGNCSSPAANVYVDGCFFRYENSDRFYENMDGSVAPAVICSNQSVTHQPTTFNKTVQELLLDIQIATPRTPNFYVASTRQVSRGNSTVYAIGQCIENTGHAICQSCMSTAYTNLYSCLPSFEGRTIDMGCFMRYSDTQFFQDNQTTNIIPFLHEGSSSKLGVILGASVGICCFLLIVALFFWCKLRKKPKIDEDASQLQLVGSYRYTDLQSATHYFSQENILGRGGYGEVFKAIVNENIVAVKRLHIGYTKAKMEFNNEVKLICNARHRNLLQLLGWSCDGPELLLVLEYMTYGSLDKYLWGEKRGTLSWRHRFDIIFGIAKGLTHLHEEFHVKIIHRDIKSSNILLDDDFQPKIADFGLARFQPEDQSHVSTRFAGTLGYSAPEYAIYGHLSEKVDTYSFGMVVLEIISGRRCTDVRVDGLDSHYLLEQAWQLYEKEINLGLIDEALDPNEYEEEHVMKIIKIALMCTQSPITLRPTMSEVVLMLSSGPSMERIQITRPTFIDADRRIHKDIMKLLKM